MQATAAHLNTTVARNYAQVRPLGLQDVDEAVKYSTADGGGADLQIDDPRESGAFGIDGMTGLEAYFCEECGLVQL